MEGDKLAFNTAANKLLRDRRIYFALNTIAGLAFIGSAAGVGTATAGLGALPVFAWPVLSALGFLPTVTEFTLGRAARNHALTQDPHVNRRLMGTEEGRIAVWKSIDTEQKALKDTLNEVLPTLRTSHHKTEVNPWRNISKKTRFQILNFLYDERQLGKWYVKEPEKFESAMRTYMGVYNIAEKTVLHFDLGSLVGTLTHRAFELRYHKSDDVSAQLRTDIETFGMQVGRLEAMKGLEQSLAGEGAVNGDLLMGFILAHRLTGRFFNDNDVKRHPECFTWDTTRTGLLRRKGFRNVQLTDRQAYVDQFGDREMRRAAQAILDPNPLVDAGNAVLNAQLKTRHR